MSVEHAGPMGAASRARALRPAGWRGDDSLRTDGGAASRRAGSRAGQSRAPLRLMSGGRLAASPAADAGMAAGRSWLARLSSALLGLLLLAGILLPVVRMYPHSKVGQWFEYMRDHREQASAAAGYVVAVVLGAMGLLHL